MKQYTVRVTKTGREWKSFCTGMDFLHDDKIYRLEWKLEGLRNLFRGHWGIAFKLPHRFEMENGEARLKR